ncbi:1-aminocyclopropane-1-carboxylate oxidase homolog 1-like [Salvia miltiorrhiza]|uniref:1-aminocyclopropane-1-carboxylate oxidase homolog 1-like n=1 Tax=Salvia miltiorrhiza TaxID=226208 RepID=UPI0025AC3CDF|nr:1-aminocyclopropane-1-carboxylate oxidase homolog 1-like [Salvia miltiorrhiza]
MANCSNGDFDWGRAVEEFSEMKTGVKGLMDAGVTELPRLFVHPPEDLQSHPPHGGQLELPTIDLDGAERGGARRREVVEQMGKAAAEWGFFRIVNHGIPAGEMDGMLEAVKRFHELPAEEKLAFYAPAHDPRPVKLNSNLPVREKDPASWRDVLTCVFRDDQLEAQLIPSALRKEMLDYVKYMMGLRGLMNELLAEALGLPTDYLSNLECMSSQSLACWYYPVCPEPNKTLASPTHSDLTFLTLLMQDTTGGLQILRDDQWFDVTPVRGALIANIADLMQIISNGKFISVRHRVRAQAVGPRISVACFFGPSVRATSKAFGPIKELLSDESGPRYREVTLLQYLSSYKSKGERVASALHYYQI